MDSFSQTVTNSHSNKRAGKLIIYTQMYM